MLGSANPDPGGATGVLATTLPDSAVISRKAVSSDGAGGNSETWSTHATVACAIDKVATWKEVAQSGRMQAVTVWKARFPLGTDLLPADRVTANTQEFEVLDTDLGVSNGLFLDAELTRLR